MDAVVAFIANGEATKPVEPDPLSTTVQRWSSRPRRRSSARRVSCKRRQTPTRSHFTKRRQHVLPEPHPISRGNICHGNPPRSSQ